MKYIVERRKGERYETIGYILDNGGKISLHFDDKEDTRFFSRVGLGDKSYTPADGAEYLKAVELSFYFSSFVRIFKEGENAAKAG